MTPETPEVTPEHFELVYITTEAYLLISRYNITPEKLPELDYAQTTFIYEATIVISTDAESSYSASTGVIILKEVNSKLQITTI